MREYMRSRRKARRNKFIRMLGGKCQICGSKTNLEFDHVNKKEKSFDYGEIQDGNESSIMKELSKCRLLCKKCHFKKTIESKDNFNKDQKPARHGTLWMYKKYKCRCNKCRMAVRLYRLKKLI